LLFEGGRSHLVINPFGRKLVEWLSDGVEHQDGAIAMIEGRRDFKGRSLLLKG
jgi:hypothetical protein